MPAKNSIKHYVKNSYYHVYNRGNNKELVFFNETDYVFFRNIFRANLREMKKDIFLDCFCLLPNHFHMVVYQENIRAMEKLMRKSITSYVMFINQRYSRVGSLFQGPYRANLIMPHQLHALRRYVLDNAMNANLRNWEHVGFGREL